jgi:hypothetical protein
VRMEITYASSSHRYLPTMSASSSSSLGSSMPNRPVKTIPLQHPNTTSSSSTPLPQAMFWRWTAKIKRTTPSQWIDTFFLVTVGLELINGASICSLISWPVSPSVSCSSPR